jgi:hypothetical protein
MLAKPIGQGLDYAMALKSTERLTRRQLQETIGALESGERYPWFRLGELLNAVESSAFWQEQGARSFTEWVRSLAHSLGRSPASLWRAMTAIRRYHQFRTQLTKRRIYVPPLETLGGSVSPENLEILEKIARVAPENMVCSLAMRVFRGQISRAALREKWEVFQPVLNGQTARGRGSAAPRINRANPEQARSLEEALLFTALQSSDGGWTGKVKPHLYEIFLRPMAEPNPSDPTGRRFDAIAVVQGQRESPLEIHGIDSAGVYFPIIDIASGNTNDHVEAELSGLAEYCDYMWAARNEEGADDLDLIPGWVGQLLIRRGRVQVMRPASIQSHNKEYLLRALLLQALR